MSKQVRTLRRQRELHEDRRLRVGVVPRARLVAAAGVEAQTEQTLRNVETILRAAGTDLQHVLRCGVFLMDMADFPKMNAVYERAFAGHKPARTTVQVAGLPGEDLRVEIDCIAVLPVS